jgi:3-hydroxyisobutyrate dehydrogenase-like beta-hydroxyacid dehydrogenase
VTTIAFLGLGAMGRPMAANLVAAGFTVRIWNRSPGRAAGLAGAVPCPTPRAAADGASFAITMLADDAAVEEVTLGADGLLPGLAAGGTHIGMSTVSLAATRRLVRAHGAAGQGYVAAPVLGRPEAAQARQLWIIAGGPASARAMAAPLFAALGQGTIALENAEEAALAKLIANFMIVATVEALGEALVLAEKGGLDPERMLGLLTGTLFNTPVYRGYGSRVARTEFLPAGFTMPLARKDVGLMLQAAEEVGAPIPLARLVQERIAEAVRRNREAYDLAGFVSVIREEAGLGERRELVSPPASE